MQKMQKISTPVKPPYPQIIIAIKFIFNLIVFKTTAEQFVNIKTMDNYESAETVTTTIIE